MWDRDWYPPSRPREAKGGIKAQTKRGQFGQSWWAQRWIAVLEGTGIGARLGRGRSYARRGQVLAVEIEKGRVRSKVQGSRPQPYSITIEAKVLSQSSWKTLADELSRQTLFAAKLLAGEMPAEIEQVFTTAGLSLFPSGRGDLQTQCSCPDWSNPCKHIAAVYYLLGEEFDRDPFLIFTLRGMRREEFLELLSAVGGPAETQVVNEREAASAEPLPTEIGRFWNGAELSDNAFGDAKAPSVAAALPRRLGSFPFWRGQVPFLDAMETTFEAASARGLEVLLGRQPAQADGSP